MAEKRLDAAVHGRVQGVGFRFHVVRVAERLGLRGWVANESDGVVRCVAEGPEDGLARLLGELRTGPTDARVDRVEASWEPATGEFVRFSVRSGWHGGD
ncbi:MAG: acylphosphatase [Chloroflexota bacterium]